MSDSSLVTRVPGEALMQALREAMSPEPPQTSAARLFGASPVPTSARSWYTGLLGELAVADELRSLPAGWLVLHSVPVGDRGSDIDHVLVSPAGRVLTVNTKHSPGGRVWVSPKAFLVNGQRRPYLRNSGHEASRAARLLGAATGGSVDVLAVIVVVGAKLTRRGTPEGVAVITLRELSAFLGRNASSAQSAVSTELVRHAVVQPRTWTRSSPAPELATDHLLWFLDLRDRVRTAARRRNAWVLAALVGALGVPVAAFGLVVATVGF